MLVKCKSENSLNRELILIFDSNTTIIFDKKNFFLMIYLLYNSIFLINYNKHIHYCYIYNNDKGV